MDLVMSGKTSIPCKEVFMLKSIGVLSFLLLGSAAAQTLLSPDVAEPTKPTSATPKDYVDAKQTQLRVQDYLTLSKGYDVILQAGTPSDAFFPPKGLLIPEGAVSVRSLADGCEDHGTVFSAIVGTRTAHSGIDGGCENPLTLMAKYATFDNAAEFVANATGAATITMSGPTYDATHAYFSTPLTATQLALLHVNQYVLLNTNPAYGSVVSSWAADGSSITVAGWIALGAGNTTPATPPATYTSGSTPIAYIGAVTHPFVQNIVLGVQPGSLASGWTGSEWDIVNNVGTPAAAGGISVYGMGNGGFTGSGINVGGTCGYACAFAYGLNVSNFRNMGIAISQTRGIGGVGLSVAMDNGTPLALQNTATGIVTYAADPSGNVVARNLPGNMQENRVVAYGSITGVASIILNTAGTNANASGVAAIPGTTARLEAQIVGHSATTTDGASWRETALYSVAANGAIAQIGTTSVTAEGASGVFTSCGMPGFGASGAAGFLITMLGCSSAAGVTLNYSADFKVTAVK